jgi:tRNA (guanine37-N1)-methyltransferase
VFAGVGPFVIPAVFTRNTLKIYANDLNPTSVEFLRENLKINKVVFEVV